MILQPQDSRDLGGIGISRKGHTVEGYVVLIAT